MEMAETPSNPIHVPKMHPLKMNQMRFWKTVFSRGLISMDLSHNRIPVKTAMIGKRNAATARAGSQPNAVERKRYGYAIYVIERGGNQIHTNLYLNAR